MVALCHVSWQRLVLCWMWPGHGSCAVQFAACLSSDWLTRVVLLQHDTATSRNAAHWYTQLMDPGAALLCGTFGWFAYFLKATSPSPLRPYDLPEKALVVKSSWTFEQQHSLEILPEYQKRHWMSTSGSRHEEISANKRDTTFYVYYQFISRCRNIKVLRVIKTFYGENVSEYLHADTLNLTLHLQIGQLVDEDFKLFI